MNKSVKRILIFALLPLTTLYGGYLAGFTVGNMPDQQTQTQGTYAPIDSYADLTVDGVVSSTNEYRAKKGLAPLTISQSLNDSAQAKARDMYTKNYWGHDAPDGTEPWFFIESTGYQWRDAGENLAYGFATSNGTVNGWISSPSHEKNLAGNYSEVGIGIIKHVTYQGKKDQTIIVAHYAQPAN